MAEPLTKEEALFLRRRVDRNLVAANGELKAFGSNSAIKATKCLYRFSEEGNHQERALAKSILMKLTWGLGDTHEAIAQGWNLSNTSVYSTSAVFSDEEIALRVKKAAERGDVLASKAITEIARRRLNGYRQNF